VKGKQEVSQKKVERFDSTEEKAHVLTSNIYNNLVEYSSIVYADSSVTGGEGGGDCAAFSAACRRTRGGFAACQKYFDPFNGSYS
jgi:hypothetical protein